MRKTIGVSLLEIFITTTVIIVLGAIAYPAYKNYLRRTYYATIVAAIQPFKAGVEQCYQAKKTFAECDGGKNHVPADVRDKGPVVSVVVKEGVITVTPALHDGILTTDLYVVTPKVENKAVTWVTSGEAVIHGYAD